MTKSASKSSTPTICLITPGHASSTPRLIKEAEALVHAGYQVHVVAGNHYAPAVALDETLFARADWSRTLVSYGTRTLGESFRKIRRKIARGMLALGASNVALAARAAHSESPRLAAAAAAVPADLYIGHCLAGLPAAAAAARIRGAPFGFDLEDFHETETIDAMNDPADRAAARLLCAKLIPECRHLTAASPLIAAECQRAYGRTPITLLNVFPLNEAPASPVDPHAPSKDHPLRLYWFSQTVGPGRGLEAVISALGLMKTPVELHLRGQCADAYRSSLVQLAEKAGLRGQPVFHASAPPAEMARLASMFHIGLSVEASSPPNRDICLTNKIFTYLLGGIPVALTPTSAQKAIVGELGDAGIILDFAKKPEEAAAAFDEWARSPDRITIARKQAWDLAHRRFNWDHEQQAFLQSVRAALKR